jgi:amino acid adenylation domain-containing protein
MPGWNERFAVSDWTETAVDFPEKNLCLHQLIEAQVEKTPENIAVDFEGRTLTYRELNARANQLAHWLRSRGVGPDVLVGICMERSLAMLIGLLGVLKAGGAYVPLDTQFPADRLRYMLEDSKPVILLSETSLTPVWDEVKLGINLFNANRDGPQLASQPLDNPRSAVRSKNLAYVIYTSGSTGRPKGVELAHRGVVNFMKSMQAEPGISSSDILLAVTTVSFDIAALELFLPLTVGARIILASRTTGKTPQLLPRILRDGGVTMMQAAPTTWRLLVDSGWEGQNTLKVLCGGEAFPRDLANQLVDRVSEVWNMYGPTETTIWSTIQRVSRGREPVPIGRPIANTQVYILDSQLKPAPVGEIGELFIGGDGLARGYLNKPDVTAERFIRNPIPGQPSQRIYRTGDLARYLPSREIQYEGRVDHQIKINGVRVEPEEIEKPILEFPGVKQCLVVARADAGGDRRLVAYIVPSNGDIQSAALRNQLTAKLPQYLIPSAFVSMPQFPLTFNGKIDRKALPDPESPNISANAAGVSEGPRDEIEYRLVTIWEDVLRVKPVGLRDNFFDLGGHSLSAARLLVRVEQSLGKEIPLADLLDAPTVEEQARLIRGHAEPQAPRASSNGSTEIPLFYLGGDPTFQPLSQRLRALYPFHSLGIQASLVRNLRDPHSLECIAERFVAAIRQRRPQGPYMVGGWCAHGLLALETAQQLRAQGEDVALVVMLETVNPEVLRRRAPVARMVRSAQLKMNLLEFEYAYVRMLPRERARDYISGRVRRKMSELGRSFSGNGDHASADQHDLDEKNLLELLYAAATNYRPRHYDGLVALVRSRKKLFGIGEKPPLGWDASLCPNLEVSESDGNHYTMYIEPNVECLAQQMSTRLRNAEQSALGRRSSLRANQPRS